MATVMLLTLVLFGLAMLLMAIGVLLRRPCLRGSCGGPDVIGPDGETLTCASCRRRRDREPIGAEDQELVD